MSSWFPTKSKPFLGNFIEQHLDTLSASFQVSMIRLFESADEIIPISVENVEFIDEFFHKSWNPICTFFLKRRALKRALKRVKSVDLIHGHISIPDGWQFAMAKSILKKPLVVTEHGSYFRKDFHYSAKMKSAIQQALKNADAVIAVSEFQAEDIENRFPFVKCHVIGNPIRLEEFQFNREKSSISHFLHVSTLDDVKNVEPMIQAFAVFSTMHPTMKLSIVSDEDASKYQFLVKSLDAEAQISFHGPISHSEIHHFYREADCLLMNSNYESFSIVIGEAWASGIPVISTSVGIAHEMSTELGILSDGTKESILIALHKISSGEMTFQHAVIQKEAEKYSRENQLQQIKSLYQSFL